MIKLWAVNSIEAKNRDPIFKYTNGCSEDECKRKQALKKTYNEKLYAKAEMNGRECFASTRSTGKRNVRKIQSCKIFNRKYYREKSAETKYICPFLSHGLEKPINPSPVFCDLIDLDLHTFGALLEILQCSPIQISIPCLINTTCFDSDQKKVDPTEDDVLDVRIVSGMFLYPDGFLILLLEAVKCYQIKNTDNAICKEVIPMIEDFYLDNMRKMYHGFSETMHKAFYFLLTEVLVYGFDKTIAWAPCNEPFNEYLTCLQSNDLFSNKKHEKNAERSISIRTDSYLNMTEFVDMGNLSSTFGDDG